MSGYGKIQTSLENNSSSDIIKKYANANAGGTSKAMEPPSIEELALTTLDTPLAFLNLSSNTNYAQIIDVVGSQKRANPQSFWSNIQYWLEDAGKWFENEALPAIEQGLKEFQEFQDRSRATIITGAQSFVEGILQFGEAMTDTAAIVTSAIATYRFAPLFFGNFLGNQMACEITNVDQGPSVLEQIWNKVQGFVAKKYVESSFDYLYDQTKYGQYLQENSYFFKQTRAISSGIGYTAGVVGTSVLTGGLTGVAAGGTAAATSSSVSTIQMAATAGMAGLGKGTQDSWSDGATVGEGLAFGTLNGIWEGLQFYIGAKIGKCNLFGTDSLGKKILSSLSRIVMDGVDSGVEGFVQPVLSMVYEDGYYDSHGDYITFEDTDNFIDRYCGLFSDYGGWGNVFTQAAIGSGSSLLGEIFDVKKFFQDELKEQPSVERIITEKIPTSEINITAELVENPNQHSSKIEVPKITQMEINAKELKTEILSSIDPDLDPLIKARKLYIELNQRLHYDPNYLTGSQELKDALFNQKVNFDNLNTKNVICSSWSQLYYELLLDCGFSKDDVQIMGGKHRWVQIGLEDGNIIIADATESINHSVDIASSKSGSLLNGFVYTDPSQSGMRLSQIHDSDFITSSAKSWLDVDRYLGYLDSENQDYFSETIKKAEGLFDQSNNYQTIFSKEQLQNHLTKIMELEIPQNMDGLEAYYYYQDIIQNIFGEESVPSISAHINFDEIIGGVESLTIVRLDGLPNQPVIAYSEGRGKIVFETSRDYYDFLKQIKLVPRN